MAIMEPTTLYYVLATALVLLGLAGTVLPALPGLPLMFGGMLLAAWAGGFRQIGAATLTVLAVLTLVSMAVDFWATAQGARRVSASRLAMLGAALGTLFGIFLGLPGLLLGPFVGALAGELLHRRSPRTGDLGRAAKIGAGTWVGLLVGTALKLAIAFAMLGVFALAWWF